jgi:hypothetical protein
MLQTVRYKQDVTNRTLQAGCYKPNVTNRMLQTGCYKPHVINRMLQTRYYKPYGNIQAFQLCEVLSFKRGAVGFPFFANVAQLHWMVGGDVIVKGRNVHRYGSFDLLGRHHHAVSNRLLPMTGRWGVTFHKNEDILKLLKKRKI